MMKNAFYFTLKALFVHKIFKCLSRLFGYVEKRLDWKHQVNFKIYNVTTRLTIICKTNISRSKGSQAMKFGQLTETLFLKNHTQNLVEKKRSRTSLPVSFSA